MHTLIDTLLQPLTLLLLGACAGLALWSTAAVATGASRYPAWITFAGAVGAMAFGTATFLPFMHPPLAALAPSLVAMAVAA